MPVLGTLGENGYTDEEMKLQNESRKILGLPDLRMTPTCVRVPVMVGHSIAVRATFEREPDLDEALGALARVPEPRPATTARRRWSGRGATRPSSAACAGTSSDPRSLSFFVVGDNLLKGAALNTVQIAEVAVRRGRVGAAARA